MGKAGFTHDFDSGFNHNCCRSAEIMDQRLTGDIFNQYFRNLKFALTRPKRNGIERQIHKCRTRQEMNRIWKK
jgi:hypothetical protein